MQVTKLVFLRHELVLVSEINGLLNDVHGFSHLRDFCPGLLRLHLLSRFLGPRNVWSNPMMIEHVPPGFFWYFKGVCYGNFMKLTQIYYGDLWGLD